MRRACLGIWLGALLAPAWAGARAAEIPADLLGRPVDAVAYTSDGPVDRTEVVGLIAIEAGRPLTDVATAATIRNLFGTRLFSNVLVEAEAAAGGGVTVTVHLWLAYRVSRVRFEGKSSLSAEDLRRAVPFVEGDPFNAAALAAGASAIERRLSSEGYPDPVVEPEADFDDAAFTVGIDYRIEAGERARVAAPFFDGETAPFDPAMLAKKGKVREGARYREATARTDGERMRKFLLTQGRFRASVELIAAEPTEDGRIRPVYRIHVGPAYTLATTGVSEKAARRELLALLDVQPFDEDLLDQWVDARFQQLQRDGRYRAKVEARTSREGDPVVVTLSIVPGPKYALRSITITGNGSVSEETLRALMVTQTKGLPVLQKGRLLDTDLKEDASAILGYYQTHGWTDAKVEKPRVTEGPGPADLNVAIAVVEGPRAFVVTRRVEGADQLSPEEIEKLVTVRTGEPFNPSAVRQDVSALTAWYRNNGWPEAAVADRYTLTEDRTKADVVYRVSEGMREFFGKTIIRGNAVTRPERILRQVAWKEGEPYSEEKVADTQQNLARTGAFRSIQVKPQPSDAEGPVRNVEIDLSEARRISLLYGFGYQYSPGAQNRNDVLGIVGGTYRNLFGRMQSATLEVQYAPLSGRGYAFASFLEPYFLNTSVPLTFVAFASREAIQDVNVDRVGGYLESVRVFRKYVRVGLRYEFQQIGPQNPEDLSTIELEQFPKSAQPIKQSAIGPSIFYDRRDDILDPQSGYYWTFAGKYAFPFLSADASYGKISGQAAWFTRLFGGVLGVSGRAGGIFPYNLAAEVPVPIAERFYAGGSSTGRGFATDLLGIPTLTVDYNTQATPITTADPGTCAETYPGLVAYDCNKGPRIIGGNGFMAWSVEYRLPLLGNFGASIFYDLAQVWVNANQINFEIEGSEGLRQSIGAGLHFMTPIGPLRLEYAQPVQRRTIPFQVTATENADGTPCDPSPCILVDGLTVKEKGRILLSIGYPF